MHNSKKTHCKHGHEFTPENTYHPPRHPHRRNCLTCLRLSAGSEESRERNITYKRAHPEKARKWRKKYNATERAKVLNRQKVSRYMKRNPEKCNARKVLQGAIAAGKMVRPDHCTRCGLIGKPEAHHPDYKKPLEVRWVCKLCHSLLHKFGS